MNREKLTFCGCVLAILMRSDLPDLHEHQGDPTRAKPKVGKPSNNRWSHRMTMSVTKASPTEQTR